MADVAASLTALAALPGVGERIEAVRVACTELRWHEALRRRVPEAAAESRVRGAQASAALDGASIGVDRVRDVMRGASAWADAPDPAEQVVRGAVQATAESEHVRSLVRTAPMQALARLHVAAAAGLVPPEQLGRPRVGDERCAELVDLGTAPDPAVVSARLAGLADVLATAGSAPAVLVAAVVHAEVATIRPFVRGNGIVARAMERVVIHATGLDPTGVVVPEAGHAVQGGPAYLGALAAYGLGTRDGLRLWLEHCCDAVLAGAQEGVRICDSVRAGRLS